MKYHIHFEQAGPYCKDVKQFLETSAKLFRLLGRQISLCRVAETLHETLSQHLQE